MSAAMKNEIQWSKSVEIKADLVRHGFASPDTYDNCFEQAIEGPAVYLFLTHDRETYTKAFVSYVGMSTCLTQRLSGHNILPLLDRQSLWTMIWFKPVEAQLLRDIERKYIEKFDPPWNVIGRRRGVHLDG